MGQDSGGSGESTGHASGRRIVELLRTKKEDVETSRWRYSLMNWGTIR